jgi:hypothetical protein
MNIVRPRWTWDSVCQRPDTSSSAGVQAACSEAANIAGIVAFKTFLVIVCFLGAALGELPSATVPL